MKLKAAANGKCWARFYGDTGEEHQRAEIKYPAPPRVKFRKRFFVAFYNLAGYTPDEAAEAIYVKEANSLIHPARD